MRRQPSVNLIFVNANQAIKREEKIRNSKDRMTSEDK